jgi:hypothetical protein
MAQLSLGLQASGNLSGASVKFETATSISKKMRVLPGAAFVANYHFSEQLAIRTGIHYLQNGVTVNTTGIDPENGDLGEIQLKAVSNLNYLQLPLNVLYFIPAGNTKFYAGAGGFASYGISGTTKLSGTYTLPDGSHETVTEQQDAYKKETDGGAGLKRFDWGAGFTAGAQFGTRWFVQAGYQLSLADIDPSKESVYKNRSAQLCIGYFFLNK